MTEWGEWREAALKRAEECREGLDPGVYEELLERIEQFVSDEQGYEPDISRWDDPADFVDDELDDIIGW